MDSVTSADGIGSLASSKSPYQRGKDHLRRHRRASLRPRALPFYATTNPTPPCPLFPPPPLDLYRFRERLTALHFAEFRIAQEVPTNTALRDSLPPTLQNLVIPDAADILAAKRAEAKRLKAEKAALEGENSSRPGSRKKTRRRGTKDSSRSPSASSRGSSLTRSTARK